HPLRELPEWTLNIKDYVGRDIGDNMHIESLLRQLSALQARKWLTKVDPKEDLEKFGLKTPAVTVTLTVKKVVTKETLATLWGLGAMETTPFAMAAVAYLGREKDKGETVTFKFGKEVKEREKGRDGTEREETYVYAQRSGADFLFLVSQRIVKAL